MMGRKNILPTVVAFILYAIFLFALIFFFGPSIKKNLEEGRYVERMDEYTKRELMAETRTFSLCYYTPYGSKMKDVVVRERPSDDLHQMLEALVDTPSRSVVLEGLISYIPDGTRLIGATIDDGIAFIDLSEEFLSSEDIEKAMDQVKKSVNALYPELRVFLLADGNPLD